jgi:hypothetical protein
MIGIAPKKPNEVCLPRSNRGQIPRHVAGDLATSLPTQQRRRLLYPVLWRYHSSLSGYAIIGNEENYTYGKRDTVVPRPYYR